MNCTCSACQVPPPVRWATLVHQLKKHPGDVATCVVKPCPDNLPKTKPREKER